MSECSPDRFNHAKSEALQTLTRESTVCGLKGGWIHWPKVAMLLKGARVRFSAYSHRLSRGVKPSTGHPLTCLPVPTEEKS